MSEYIMDLEIKKLLVKGPKKLPSSETVQALIELQMDQLWYFQVKWLDNHRRIHPKGSSKRAPYHVSENPMRNN